MAYEASVQEDEDSAGSATYWIKQIKKEDGYWADWEESARKIVNLYKKQKKETGQTDRKYAMLWANTEVLKPSVYARPPLPQVSRRFKDADEVGREASQVLERVLSTSNEMEGDDDEYIAVRDDLLLPGRGTARVRYGADVVPTPDPTTGQMVEKPTNERAILEHFHWNDFRHGRARKWKQVPWVAFRSFLTKEKWNERFNPDGEDVENTFKPITENATSGSETKVNEGKAAVWEIWSKTDAKVYWISTEHKDILEEAEPHLKFRGFFPCPKPVYSTQTTDSLIPTPDYKYYQDQAEEIDGLTKRIGKLQSALKLVGFYPGGSENSGEIEEALSAGVENRMIPLDSFSAFADKGGINQIVWLPIKDVVQVLEGCVSLRRQLIEDVYQITGISDILRGSTDPRETKGAQQIKAQWGSIRIRGRQQEMVRFCRDIQELKAEIVSENFQLETLKEMSGIALPSAADKAKLQQMMQQAQQQAQMTGQPAPPMEQPDWADKPTWEDVIQLLRDDRMRSFRVDVETDSTVQPDEQAEKASRNEFLQVVGGYIAQAGPVVQAFPPLASLAGELLMFTVRGYRAGRELEDEIEKTVDGLKDFAEQQLKQQQEATQQPPPDPKMIELQGKAEAEKAKMQYQVQSDQAKAQDDQLKFQFEQQKAATEQSRADAQMQADAEHRAAELALKREEMAFQAQIEELKVRSEIALKNRELEQNAQFKAMEMQREADEEALEAENMANAPDANAELMAVMNQMAELVAALQQGMTAPKTVIRDQDGRVAGVETRLN